MRVLGGGLLLLAALLLAASLSAKAHAASLAPDAGGLPCAIEDIAGIGRACDDGDVWHVFLPDGTPLGDVHKEPDSPATAESGTNPAWNPGLYGDWGFDNYKEQAYACDGFHTRIVNAYPADHPWYTVPEDMRQYAHAAILHAPGYMSGKINLAAEATGGTATMRHCPQAFEAALATPSSQATFASIAGDLANLGFNDPKVKYIVFYWDYGNLRQQCQCVGQASLQQDDRHDGLVNLNNGNSGVASYAMYYHGPPNNAYAIRQYVWNVMLHEWSHTLGAVQPSAPHTTGAWHCTQEYDTMCYDDNGPTSSMSYVCTDVQPNYEYDCGHDDYFHRQPAHGSYLNCYWNIGDNSNRFLAFGGPESDLPTLCANQPPCPAGTSGHSPFCHPLPGGNCPPGQVGVQPTCVSPSPPQQCPPGKVGIGYVCVDDPADISEICTTQVLTLQPLCLEHLTCMECPSMGDENPSALAPVVGGVPESPSVSLAPMDDQAVASSSVAVGSRP